MADEVRLGVAVVPVRVSLDELDKGLAEARQRIEAGLGQAWGQAGSGAEAFQKQVGAASGSVGQLSGRVGDLAGQTSGARAAAEELGSSLDEGVGRRGVQALATMNSELEAMTGLIRTVVALGGVGMAAGAIGQVISGALDYGEAGARLANIRQSYNRLATDMGANSRQMLSDMQWLSSATMSQAELMERYNVGVGLAGEAVASRFGDYIQMARAAAAQTGQSFDYMLSSALIATGRLSNVIADNLTIVVDTALAYDQYAASIGKTADELTKLEMQEAFAIEMLAQAEAKFGDLDEVTQDLTGQGIARLRASWADLKNEVQTEVTPAIDDAADAVSTWMGLLSGAGLTRIGSLLDVAEFEGNTLVGKLAVRGLVEEVRGLEAMDVAAMSAARFNALVKDLAAVSPEAAAALRELRNEGVGVQREMAKGDAAMWAMGQGAQAAQVDLSALGGAVQNLTGYLSNMIGMASGAGDALAGMGTDLHISMMKAQDYARGITKPQLDWYTTGKMPWELPEAYREYTRALGTWIEGLGRQLWRDHESDIRSAGGAYNDLQSAMESYYQSWQSQAEGILAPTQSFDLSAMEQELGIWTDKWDEPARRAMDVFKKGTESPWAEPMGLGSKEEALQYVRDFYAGRLPEDVNWDAAIGQYQQQMEQMLGQQNLAAMFQEKLVTAGWGPENETVMAALEAPFTPGGTNSAQAFATAFSDYDWEGTATATSDRIMSALSAELSKGAGKYAPWFESFVIRTVERVFFGGEKP